MLTFGLLTEGALGPGTGIVPGGGGGGGGSAGGIPDTALSSPTVSLRDAEATDTLVEFLPWYFHADPRIRALMAVVAAEAKRIEAAGAELRSEWFVGSATARVGLPAWELILGLPVDPVGLTEDQRRDLIVANMRGRHSPRGSDWQAALSRMLGTGWSYREDVGAYTVRISMPYASGSYTAQQVLALARLVTPAHLAISTTYGAGFLVGISLIGIDVL